MWLSGVCCVAFCGRLRVALFGVCCVYLFVGCGLMRYWFVACSKVLAVACALRVVRCALVAARCRLLVVCGVSCWLLVALCCLLRVAWCVVRCALFAV